MALLNVNEMRTCLLPEKSQKERQYVVHNNHYILIILQIFWILTTRLMKQSYEIGLNRETTLVYAIPYENNIIWQFEP